MDDELVVKYRRRLAAFLFGRAQIQSWVFSVTQWCLNSRPYGTIAASACATLENLMNTIDESWFHRITPRHDLVVELVKDKGGRLQACPSVRWGQIKNLSQSLLTSCLASNQTRSAPCLRHTWHRRFCRVGNSTLSHRQRCLQTASAAQVFVHVLNPFGMAWIRRVNEQTSTSIAISTTGAAYERVHWLQPLAPILNPSSPPGFDFFL